MFQFLSINIETTDWCNRKCTFCPNANIDKEPEFMEKDLYLKVLDELAEHDYVGRVHLFQRGEPLLDERLEEWTEIARKKLPKCYLMISTNGDFLTRARAISLLRAGMSEMWVSHYDGIRENLVRDTSDFQNILHFGKEKLEETFFNRAGLVDVPTKFTFDDNFCWWIFRKAGITCRGDLQLCCADWFPGELGNVRESKLADIWPGEKLLEYWIAHVNRNGKQMPKCKDCNLLK